VSGRRARLAVAAVLFILGFLAIVQLRSQSGGTGLDALTTQDLSALIASLNARNEQLATEVGTLETQLRDMQAARALGESSAGGLRADLRRLRLWAGLDPVRGQGVTVDVSGTIAADAVGDLLNELRSAGAEALAIDDRRIVAATVVSGEAGALLLDGEPLPPAFRVVAIGNPVNLAAALTRVGGVVGRIEVANPDATISVAPADALVLPASDRSFAPVHARPRV
jgi:uncharacterized protein YlxW (UPF0749 family)